MDPPTSIPNDTPSIGELSAAFAKQKRAKSPPLAFEKTPNDTLAPLTSPTRPESTSILGAALSSPTMGRLNSPPPGDQQDLQVIVDQQTSAIQLLHDAFAAERQAWSLERERLYYRIASLEKLLRTGDGYSPAKSPVLSPMHSASVTSPQSRARTSSSRLPSIAEDENIPPLSQRREGAPRSIDIPAISHEKTDTVPSVSFDGPAASDPKVEEIPLSPTQTAHRLSPPPFQNRMDAGHTPLKAPRPPTPPPQNSMSMDGIEDTPTRHNTHINTYLTRSNDEEDDKELKGPLHMPELPHEPGDTNFTFDMLSRRLEQIEKHPETSKPMVFSQPSPGLASPAEKEDQPDLQTADTDDFEGPVPPPTARAVKSQAISSAESRALSPSGTSNLSKVVSNDDKVQADFENGGIRLKKRPSVNFGAPLGQMSSFANARKLS